MNDALNFAGVLLHTFGLLMFGGGLIWATSFMMKAQKSDKPHGKAFMAEFQPTMMKIMMIGIFLLLGGGLLRMVALDRLGTLGNFDNSWDAVMTIKFILFVVVLVNGFILMLKVAPTTGKLAPKGPGEKPSPEFLKYVGISQKIGMMNVLLGMIIVVLSVVAVVIH